MQSGYGTQWAIAKVGIYGQESISSQTSFGNLCFSCLPSNANLVIWFFIIFKKANCVLCYDKYLKQTNQQYPHTHTHPQKWESEEEKVILQIGSTFSSDIT